MKKTKEFIQVLPALQSKPGKECMCVFVYLWVRGFRGGKKKGKKKKKKTQGWLPVPSVSLLDRTGILIRSAE